MRVVDVDDNIIQELRNSGLSSEMKSLEFCKFLVIEEEHGKIVAASGIGGFLNNHSLQILDGYQGKGLGKKLFKENIEEAKKKNYSFITYSNNPENTPIVKLVRHFEFTPLFRIHYSDNLVRDAGILVFKTKGKVLEKILKLFNTKIGIVILAISLKIFRKLTFRSLLTLPPDEFPSPDLMYIIKNFQKI